MLQIDNKFEIGQEVYVIQKVRVKKPCSACNGEGHKIIDGNKYYCSRCDGEGFLRYETKKEYQVVGLKEVTLIKTLTHPQGQNSEPRTEIKYNVGNIKEVPEHHLFVNGEEAIAECDKLNNPESEEE